MKSRPCPICKKPRAEAFAPFCSPRCKLADLHNWFNEEYRVSEPLPIEPAPENKPN